MERDVKSPVESLVKIPSLSIDPSEKKNGKKIHFSPKVVKVPKNPLTRATTNIFPME